MRNHETDLTELLQRLDMQTWLDSQGIDYTVTRGRSGRQLNVQVCPVCGNSDRKVYLNAETGAGNCFGGSHPPGENFSKWKFIRAVLNDLPGGEVVRHIQAHVEVRPWVAAKPAAPATVQPTSLVLPDSYTLPQGRQNLTYLMTRGITPEVTAEFQLRYCHHGFFPYELDGEQKRMWFNERVLIPVFDLDGKMVTFQGRDITGTRSPKYLFPPGLPATGNQLLNGHRARNTKRVVVGEGGFDVMALRLAFVTDSSLGDVVPLGTFGKHLSYGPGDTQEQKFLELAKRGVTDVTFMWDGEERATADAVEAGLRLRGWGFNVRVGMLPAFKDPNEVSADVVCKTYHKAIPLTPASAVQILFKRKAMNRT